MARIPPMQKIGPKPDGVRPQIVRKEGSSPCVCSSVVPQNKVRDHPQAVTVANLTICGPTPSNFPRRPRRAGFMRIRRPATGKPRSRRQVGSDILAPSLHHLWTVLGQSLGHPWTFPAGALPATSVPVGDAFVGQGSVVHPPCINGSIPFILS